MDARKGLRLSLAVVAATLTGCTLETGVGFNTVLGYEGLGRRIETYYGRRAWERNATCTLPRMRILRADVLDETDDEIVALVRYSWSDSSRDNADDGLRAVPGGSGFGRCRGIDERRFTLEKVDGGVVVVAMSGPQRPRPIGGHDVTVGAPPDAADGAPSAAQWSGVEPVSKKSTT